MKSEVDSSGNPVNENAPNDTVNPEAPIETASAEAKTEEDSSGNPVDETVNPEAIRGTASGEEMEGLNVTTEPSADTTKPSEESGLEVTINTGMESELGAIIDSELNATDGTQLDQATLEITALLDKSTIIDEAPANADNVAADNAIQDAGGQDSDEEIRSDSPLNIDDVDFTDSSTMVGILSIAY